MRIFFPHGDQVPWIRFVVKKKLDTHDLERTDGLTNGQKRRFLWWHKSFFFSTTGWGQKCTKSSLWWATCKTSVSCLSLLAFGYNAKTWFYVQPSQTVRIYKLIHILPRQLSSCGDNLDTKKSVSIIPETNLYKELILSVGMASSYCLKEKKINS